jgi:hypothetical protein
MPDFEPGKMYVRLENGSSFEVPKELEQLARVWICRRVADFPFGEIPPGAAVCACSKCSESIAYNPKKTLTAPKTCAQCEGLVPSPMAVVS